MHGSVKRYADIGLRLPSTSERWSGDAFRTELHRWIASEVGEPTSLEPVKVRPWATVWRVETDTGRFYAKQNCPTQSYEADLLVALNDLAARHVVPLTAVEPIRGLFLTPDQGEPLGEAGAADVDDWCRVVSAGAQLQLEVARYADRLVRVGLTALAPGDCVAYVEEQLDSFAALPPDDPRAMPSEEQQRVRSLLPTVAGWADQVAGLGLPLTLCHNDLHAGNVFDRGGELRFFDFGDALVTEPLGALLIPLHLLARELAAPPDDPRLLRVVDAALEVWSDYATLGELREAVPAALQLARLARVESWIRCTAPMNPAELDEWGTVAGQWLASLTTDPPVRHVPG